MARFTIQYHLNGTDFVPQESIDADTVQDAAKMASERTLKGHGDDTILVQTDNDMIAFPRTSIIYCYVRAIVDRRRSNPSLRIDDGEDEAA